MYIVITRVGCFIVADLYNADHTHNSFLAFWDYADMAVQYYAKTTTYKIYNRA